MTFGLAAAARRGGAAPVVERWVLQLRWVAVAVWVGIPVLGLVAQPVAGRIVWTVAVAGLPLFIVLVGYHRWRRICPLAFVNQLPHRLGWMGTARMPGWLEDHYYYVPLGTFVLGLWLRLIWTNGDGLAIAIFFVGLSLVAFIVGALTTGKTWCNYLCPVSFIEKVYTEPIGLRQTANSQCASCSACKKACPDINEENAYWKELELASKRTSYFAYPGLIFGFYLYYFLQSGTWDYYFGGSWTDEPGLVGRAFVPGSDATTAGFFFLPIVPRAVAAFLTLLLCATISWLAFDVVERVLTFRRLPHARHTMLALAGFVAFVTFYSFAGQPTLRKLDWLPPVAAIFTISVAAFTLMRRASRTHAAFAEASIARNLLKRWPWGDARPESSHDVVVVHQTASRERELAYSQVLQAYRDAVHESLAEGLVTRADVQRLNTLRDRLHIRFADHERIMRELAEDESLDRTATPPSPEKRLQLVAYTRALHSQLERILESDDPTDTAGLQRLQHQFGVTPAEHASVLADLLGRSPRAQQAVEAIAGRIRTIDTALSVLQTCTSPEADFLSELLMQARARSVERTAQILPDAYNSAITDAEMPTLEACLVACTEDPDPYIRAIALYAVRKQHLASADLIDRLSRDEHDLVRATATHASDTATVHKMTALRQVAVFRRLTPPSLAALACGSQARSFAPGEPLCVQGELGEDVIVVLEGDALVTQAMPDGERTLRTQHVGDVIGELAVLDPAPRSATVRAGSNGVRALILSGEVFRDTVKTDGEVAASIMQTLVRHLRVSGELGRQAR